MSFTAKAHNRQPKATATDTNWPAAKGPAVAIQRRSRRCAPTMGNTDCATARIQARANAK
ncbi:hypothetical protein Rmf_49310 [Roseomonas fluvialis]|uniref:Uncharacterized protein n=1 Tax=Roseomonas fluvialis TaxID=1750527 RepID=A0ABN6P810_9PROT|nr:hypothetical protein Rmf_49310 [Roseomonas fluvialis]